MANTKKTRVPDAVHEEDSRRHAEAEGLLPANECEDRTEEYMSTKSKVDSLWRQFRESINKAYAVANKENSEATALRDYAKNVGYQDGLSALLGRESANERQHRKCCPSGVALPKNFSIDTASKLIIMDNAAQGAKLANESKPMPSAALFLVCRQTAIESEVIGYLAARFISKEWIEQVGQLDYAELMKSE